MSHIEETVRLYEQPRESLDAASTVVLVTLLAALLALVMNSMPMPQTAQPTAPLRGWADVWLGDQGVPAASIVFAGQTGGAEDTIATF